MPRLVLERTRDGIWVATDRATGKVAGAFFAEGGGWWRIFYANGTSTQMWVPGAEHPELDVARRMISKR